MADRDRKQVGVRLLWGFFAAFALAELIGGLVVVNQSNRGLSFGNGNLHGVSVKSVNGVPLPDAKYPLTNFGAVNIEVCEDRACQRAK
jgi:hypothetical protein